MRQETENARYQYPGSSLLSRVAYARGLLHVWPSWQGLTLKKRRCFQD